jgi:TRAP-type transport system periplasmic protein
MKMRHLIVLKLLVVSMFVFHASSAFAQGASVTLNLAHVGAPVSPQQTIGQLFADKVAEKTGGSVIIRLHDSGTLGNERQLQDGVTTGTIDIAIAGTFSHSVPFAGILEAPLLYRDLDHFVNAFSGEVGDELLAHFAQELGAQPLFIAPHGGFRYITTKSTPIRAPRDLEGLRLRNPNVPAFNVMAQVAGALPVPLDFSELYVALDRGVVDGQHNPVGHVVGSQFFEVQDYLSMVPWGISPHVVTMSSRAWNRLSAEQQEAVMEAARETAREYPAVAKAQEDEQLEFLRDRMTIVTPDEIDMEAFSRLFEEEGLPGLEREYGEAGARWVRAILDVE